MNGLTGQAKNLIQVAFRSGLRTSEQIALRWQDVELEQNRKNVWTPALKKAGIKYRTPYQTRHTFASTLLSRGENPPWVAQQMGRKDWGQIIKIYGRWIPQSK